MNADRVPAEVPQYCAIDDNDKNVLRAAIQQMQMSARAYHRMRNVKPARTLADLVESHRIETLHLAEAIQYQSRKQI